MNLHFAEIPPVWSLSLVRRALFVGVALFGLGLGACDWKPGGEVCEAGATKQVDCNTCTCEAGAWACTEKACAPYDPCLGSACGDPCTVCDPADPDCVETQELKACNALGVCVSATPDLGCGGEECKLGDIKQVDCNSCGCTDGVWTCTQIACEVYEPCAGKICGDACTVCDPGAEGCVETDVIKACDPQGACVPEVPELCAAAPYDPCAGKLCGEACAICDPDDPECVETQELKVCNAEGVCVSDPGADVCL